MLKRVLWRVEIALIGVVVFWQFVSSIIFGVRVIMGG
jgi:hypothetical protein